MLLSVLFSLKIVARPYAWLGSDPSVSQITSRCHQNNQIVIRFLVVTYVFYIHPTQLYCLLLQGPMMRKRDGGIYHYVRMKLICNWHHFSVFLMAWITAPMWRPSPVFFFFLRYLAGKDVFLWGTWHISIVCPGCLNCFCPLNPNWFGAAIRVLWVLLNLLQD